MEVVAISYPELDWGTSESQDETGGGEDEEERWGGRGELVRFFDEFEED